MSRIDVDTDLIIKLYTEDHLTYREIAERCGISCGTVGFRLKWAGVTREQGTQVRMTCSLCGSPFTANRSRAHHSRVLFCSDACRMAAHWHNPEYVQYRQGQRRARALVARYVTLQPGYIVHHHDSNTRHNCLANLAVFVSHAAHMRFHRGGEATPLWDGRTLQPTCACSRVEAMPRRAKGGKHKE